MTNKHRWVRGEAAERGYHWFECSMCHLSVKASAAGTLAVVPCRGAAPAVKSRPMTPLETLHQAAQTVYRLSTLARSVDAQRALSFAAGAVLRPWAYEGLGVEQFDWARARPLRQPHASEVPTQKDQHEQHEQHEPDRVADAIADGRAENGEHEPHDQEQHENIDQGKGHGAERTPVDRESGIS